MQISEPEFKECLKMTSAKILSIQRNPTCPAEDMASELCNLGGGGGGGEQIEVSLNFQALGFEVHNGKASDTW